MIRLNVVAAAGGRRKRKMFSDDFPNSILTFSRAHMNKYITFKEHPLPLESTRFYFWVILPSKSKKGYE